MEMANRILKDMALIKSSQTNKRPPTIKQVPSQSQGPPGYGSGQETGYYQPEKQPSGMTGPGGQMDLTGGYPSPPPPQGGYMSPTSPASPRQQTPASMYGDPRYGQQPGSLPPSVASSPQQQYPGTLPPRPPPPPGHQRRVSAGSAGGYPEQSPYGAPPGRGAYDQQQQASYSVRFTSI
jgi:hypothetical protein